MNPAELIVLKELKTSLAFIANRVFFIIKLKECIPMDSSVFKVINTDAELFAAAINQIRVYVMKELETEVDVIVDYGGVIQKYTSEYVKIQDVYYSRDIHRFRICIK
ncbi:hypothetical protein [Paenibacillus nuruki]|uniref:hypothetical protein n=1 Tax=Paenibacillus nuruki TaxID=1886670 RepID=UPI002803AC86|nr:hypothetical protein [Paenibacillus nuruki]CAJ1315889.1 hypothetical protein AASFL403_11750 [Paenibacillus nuruki]